MNGELSPKHVVHLRLIKSEGRYSCPHSNVIVDEQLFMLQCEDCGCCLNPIEYLVRIAKREHQAEYRLAVLNRQIKEAEGKLRTKCVHCGGMTPIPSRPYSQVMHDLVIEGQIET